MEHAVHLSGTATREFSRATAWYGDQDEALGRRWHEGIFESIDSLSTDPERHPLSHETDDFDFDLREVYYGVGRRKTHRILFRIDNDGV